MKKLSEKIYFLFLPIFSALLYFTLSAYFMHSSGEWYYLDSDSYTRYLRIIDWIDDFSWLEKLFPFTNCPHGEILHFTRISDVIWFFFSLPFIPFYNMHDAVFYGGLIFAPTFFVFTLLLYVQLLKKQISPDKNSSLYILMFFLTFLFLISSTVFYFGRPDHHCLMLFILAATTYIVSDSSAKKIYIAGILCACGIWCSSAIEGGILCAAIIFAIYICWLLNRISSNIILSYLLSLCLGIGCALIINPPYQGLLYPDNERLSVIHFAASFLAYAIFAVITKFNPATIGKKILLTAGASFISIIILFGLFGTALFSPVYDDTVFRYFVPFINEMQEPEIYEYGYLALGIISLLILHFIPHKKTTLEISVAILFIFYLPLSATIRRFIYYSIALYAIINILTLTNLFSCAQKSNKLKMTAFICLIANIFFVFSFQYATAPLYPYQNLPKLEGCVLTDIFSAPYVIYKTEAKTIGSPYHNNIDGIKDAVNIFKSENENEVKNLLKKRHIKHIFIPKQSLYHLQSDKPNSLYNRLLYNNTYTWIEKISDDKDSFLLFRVYQ